MASKFYDATKILSLKDIDGNKPEIYISTSNRSAGKTTFFNRYCVKRFKRYGEKFMVMYRFNYELDDCADKFFKEIKNLFFPTDNMRSEKRSMGMYHELFLNDEPCGYAIALNNADQIKKNSHYFSDVKRILFDEFQSETNHYCPNEVKKFQSVHTSVARGDGKQVRYVPVIMISNPISMINPYYIAMGISSRLDNKTKYLRGKGYVLEQGYVESASKAQAESGFNKAFANDQYQAYNAQGVYLNDNLSFIEKMEGRSRYLVTLRYEGKDYAIREFAEKGIVYCDNHVDYTFPYKIAISTDDHSVNYVMLRKNDFFLSNLKELFQLGSFRFKDLKCKEAVLASICY